MYMVHVHDPIFDVKHEKKLEEQSTYTTLLLHMHILGMPPEI